VQVNQGQQETHVSGCLSCRGKITVCSTRYCFTKFYRWIPWRTAELNLLKKLLTVCCFYVLYLWKWYLSV